MVCPGCTRKYTSKVVKLWIHTCWVGLEKVHLRNGGRNSLDKRVWWVVQAGESAGDLVLFPNCQFFLVVITWRLYHIFIMKFILVMVMSPPLLRNSESLSEIQRSEKCPSSFLFSITVRSSHHEASGLVNI